MKTVEIICVIRQGAKNNRFLCKNSSGDYLSFKGASDKYHVGDMIQIDDYYLQIAEQDWVEKFEKQSSIRNKVLTHLIEYKLDVLNESRRGRYNGNEYDHILPIPEKNLLRGYGFDNVLDDVFSLIKSAGEIHPGFANLNSSQAFAINLFSPIIKNKSFNDILRKENSGIACFEKVLDPEEETHFDLYLESGEGIPAWSFEVKYTEPDFGKADIDKSHIRKFEDIYHKLMLELTGEIMRCSDFFDKYQLWRNLSYIVSRKQHVCFVFPKFREDLKESIICARDKCKDKYREWIHILFADDIVDDMCNCGDAVTKRYYEAFRKKYLEIE